ncbi:alpha-aspartyl dipeptidase [Anoplophora glabripennis]|uniref:dipeptidase E n=1 Tax=Anoplophora glabripennis TaxID=217634 RepID=V5G8N2_ANOGL|nr:alpha-aspartyl dipeptidase [Anoplophora glabripennis]
MLRQILLLSSSKVHGHEFLEYAANDICEVLNGNKVSTVLFIPYALSDHDAYLKKVEIPFKKWGYCVEGIHKVNPLEAVEKAEAIFVGGGNTFRLLKTLYDLNLVKAIAKKVLKDGIPYIGTSAGTNVATRSIHTTNDMPIVYPPTFEALNLVPFNINPHYLDADPNSKHKGETREERILQYLEEKESNTVLGLHEGSTLYIKDNTVILKGLKGARLFIKGKDPLEIDVGSNLSYLLKTEENMKT